MHLGTAFWEFCAADMLPGTKKKSHDCVKTVHFYIFQSLLYRDFHRDYREEFGNRSLNITLSKVVYSDFRSVQRPFYRDFQVTLERTLENMYNIYYYML